MNLRNEKGITLVALVITIILMMILLGVGINFGGEAIKKSKLEDIKTDMISIKTRAKIVAEQYNFKDIENLVGSQISDAEAQKLGVTNNDKYCKWSSSDLVSQNLGAIEGDVYVIYYDLENPNNCEIYYLDGYEGKYSLTDLKNL